MTEIVVSINPRNIQDINSIQVKSLTGADVIEWRADYLSSQEEIFELAPIIFEKFSGLNILFTLRTIHEGGLMNVSSEEYIDILRKIMAYSPSFIDIEYFSYPEALSALSDYKDQIVLSCHDFVKIPRDLASMLDKMLAEDCYLSKFAGMPTSKKDVLDLMSLTEELTRNRPSKRLATIAMGDLGKLSRVSGYLTGSAWTFVNLGKETAPGQIPLNDARKMLDILGR
ncbi:type I 3-dehydroquinate dehydratase [Streptococcaceae bacterium ESL0729]|nr:type I 3-dehydroquinate dehydratase [Streptococcaceae bacterium ESL0729]